MNIFYLDSDFKKSAQFHNNKHVVKMIVEYAQLLSTAHRILDGEEYIDNSSGRRIRRWKLSNNDSVLYKATHINHPSAKWVRESSENYYYLFNMFSYLLDEYSIRYNKVHKTSSILAELAKFPKNISKIKFTEPPQAMPEYCQNPKDTVLAYRTYYLKEKSKILQYTNREIPYWVK